jgi:DtxR family Mn-dependent transcriptional regulator
MSVSRLSTSTQNYLKAIWSLQEWSNDPVTPSSMAAKTGVKLSTASDAVRKLTDQGLVEHNPYGAVTLTEEGRLHAVAMVRRHRLIETFLVEVLDYSWDQVHDEAESLEHAVSDFMVERLDEHLGHPHRDPHGDPIPSADGDVTQLDAMLLSSVPLGSVVETRPAAPYSGALEVLVSGDPSPIALGRSATDSIWVTASATDAVSPQQ